MTGYSVRNPELHMLVNNYLDQTFCTVCQKVTFYAYIILPLMSRVPFNLHRKIRKRIEKSGKGRVTLVSTAYQRSVLFCASIMLSIKGALMLSCFSRTVMTSSNCDSHSGWLISRTWTTKSYINKGRGKWQINDGGISLFH